MPLREVSSTDGLALQALADTLAGCHKYLIITGAGISTSCGIPDFRSKDGLYNFSLARVIPPQTSPLSLTTASSSSKLNADTSHDKEASGLSHSQGMSISTNPLYAGSTPRMSGKDLFDVQVFQSVDSITMFYRFIAILRRKIYDEIKNTSDTHKFIKALQVSGRLMRCYTQNIDGLEVRDGLCTNLSKGKGNRRRFSKKCYPGLPPADTTDTDFDSGCQVVQLHGELSHLRCRVCSIETVWTKSDTDTFLAGASPECVRCKTSSEKRMATGRRGLVVGEMRPNIVLYGEDHPQNSTITSIITYDATSQPDVLVIMGTSLKVHGLKNLVKDFAKVVHSHKDGRVVLVNQTRPSKSMWDGIIDEYIKMDCDEWVRDLHTRRPDLWVRRSKLDLKTTKGSTRNKRGLEVAGPEDAGPQPVAKKQKTRIDNTHSHSEL